MSFISLTVTVKHVVGGRNKQVLPQWICLWCNIQFDNMGSVIYFECVFGHVSPTAARAAFERVCPTSVCAAFGRTVFVLQQPKLPLDVSVLHQLLLLWTCLFCSKLFCLVVSALHSGLCCLWTCPWPLAVVLPLDVSVLQQPVVLWTCLSNTA